MTKSRAITYVILLLIAAAGIRSTALVARWGSLQSDPDAYRLIAENLREGGVYSRAEQGAPRSPTAFRPPLYPLLLALLAWDGHVTPQVVAALHLVLGVSSVWLALILARKWGLGPWSYLVAVLVACDPILANQSTEVMTETLATFMTLVGLLAVTRIGYEASWHSCLVAGVALGLATLCRPTFLVWTGLICLWLTVRWRRSPGIHAAVLVFVGWAILMAPWVIRNQFAMGTPIIATTHGGYTLLLGNNQSFYEHLREGEFGSVWDAEELLPIIDDALASSRVPEVPDRLDRSDPPHPEIVADQRLYDLARETIRQQPGMFAYACLIRLGRLWTPLPHQLSDEESAGRRLMRWLIAVWYSVVGLLALCGVWHLGRRMLVAPWMWGLLCVLSLTAVHAVYWSNMRMRAPAMPFVYLLVALGCSVVFQQWAARRAEVTMQNAA